MPILVRINETIQEKNVTDEFVKQNIDFYYTNTLPFCGSYSSLFCFVFEVFSKVFRGESRTGFYIVCQRAYQAL